jgi:hypothetical protein
MDKTSQESNIGVYKLKLSNSEDRYVGRLSKDCIFIIIDSINDNY